MEPKDALEVLKTEEALHPKLSVKQFVVLSVFTLVIPVITLIVIGASLS